MNLFGCSLTAILATLSLVCDGCKTINIESDETGLTVFTRMTNTSDGSHGRSSYISQFNGSTSYLYFGIENIHAGTGRWIISDKLAATDRAVAFVGETLL